MHMYGRDLAEAFEWLQRYQKTKDTTDLHQAWEYYFLVRFQHRPGANHAALFLNHSSLSCLLDMAGVPKPVHSVAQHQDDRDAARLAQAHGRSRLGTDRARYLPPQANEAWKQFQTRPRLCKT
jgi:hypothetical protein